MAGYYDSLIAFLDHAAGEQFVRMDQRRMLVVESVPTVLLDRLATYAPSELSKWVGLGQT